MTHHVPRVDLLVRELMAGRLSRRSLARRAAALGVGRRSLAAAGSSALVLPATARRARAKARQNGPGGIVGIAQTGGDPGIGNPILVGGRDNYPFWWAFSRLVTYDDKGTPVPDLADEWSYNEAGTELTLNLNPNAQWHDGAPVTSADVIFTLDKIQDPNTDTDLAGRLQVAGSSITWAAPDPQTVVLTLPTAFAPFLFSLSFIGIIPKHLLEGSADINTDPFNTAPIGSGPFRITEWEVGVFTRYERFDNYHRGVAAADQLLEIQFEDVAPALASLEAGDQEVDVVFTPPESQERFENNPDFLLLRYVYFTPITLSFNWKDPRLADLQVREAMRLAIDKDALAEVLTKGRNTRADNQYADTGPLDRFNDYSLGPDEFNIEKANALLDEAGWVLNGDVREKDGERLDFSMVTYSGFEEYRNGLEILQQVLGEIGVQTRPEVIDYSTLFDKWSDPDDDPLTRSLAIEEYPHPFEQDPDVYIELSSEAFPASGFNYNYVADAEIDRLIDEGRTTTDDEARIAIYHQLDARRRAVCASVPLYLATDGWVFNRAVGGVPEDTPSSRWFLRCCANMLYKTE